MKSRLLVAGAIAMFCGGAVNADNLPGTVPANLLKALAVAGPVAEPMSGAFVAKHGLRAASSVSSTVGDLESRDLI